MIVDSSALAAMLFDEIDAPRHREALVNATHLRMSSATFAEIGIVVDSRAGLAAGRRLDRLISDLEIEIVPVDADQATIARQAYREFGRGSGHPARLNFGDCFSYALASVTDEPLLFKGDDFAHTDVRSALPTE